MKAMSQAAALARLFILEGLTSLLSWAGSHDFTSWMSPSLAI